MPQELKQFNKNHVHVSHFIINNDQKPNNVKKSFIGKKLHFNELANDEPGTCKEHQK